MARGCGDHQGMCPQDTKGATTALSSVTISGLHLQQAYCVTFNHHLTSIYMYVKFLGRFGIQIKNCHGFIYDLSEEMCHCCFFSKFLIG